MKFGDDKNEMSMNFSTWIMCNICIVVMVKLEA